jgi:hypothetical protein
MNKNGAYCSPEGKWQGSTKPDGVEFKPLGVIALATAIKDIMGTLQCTDGRPYQSKKLFKMSTHVCRHCGQHKTQHMRRFVHISMSHIDYII